MSIEVGCLQSANEMRFREAQEESSRSASLVCYTAPSLVVAGLSKSMISFGLRCQLAQLNGESPFASRIVRSAAFVSKTSIALSEALPEHHIVDRNVVAPTRDATAQGT